MPFHLKIEFIIIFLLSQYQQKLTRAAKPTVPQLNTLHPIQLGGGSHYPFKLSRGRSESAAFENHLLLPHHPRTECPKHPAKRVSWLAGHQPLLGSGLDFINWRVA
jgi:hypothetical protein